MTATGPPLSAGWFAPSERAATPVAHRVNGPRQGLTPRESGGSDRGRVAVTGDVDASNADDWRLAILDAATDPGAQLEVDLAGVTFIDSTGLMAIADASVALERTGRWLVVCNVPRQVLRILEITGIGATLEVRR
jgi:anti-sigma B factor antagonist